MMKTDTKKPDVKELRDHERSGVHLASRGRSYCYITCPFCNAEVKAYVWSLAGGGKRCPCGALHGNYGTSTKKIN
jgi:hypothetical protein